MRRHARQRGVTLIESLASLLVLSIGVLAVVGLQLAARRSNLDAAQRSFAAQLAYDILERMRSNSTPAALARYRTGAGALGRGSLGAEPVPACTAGQPCTPLQLAAHDLWQWEQALDGAAEKTGDDLTGGLRQPSACIDGPAAGGDGLYTVTIAWRGAAEMPDGAGTPCGRDPQGSGASLYSKSGSDNRYRRTLSLPAYITARRRTAP